MENATASRDFYIRERWHDDFNMVLVAWFRGTAARSCVSQTPLKERVLDICCEIDMIPC